MNLQANGITLNIWEGGWPIWIEITTRNGDTIKINHQDLHMFRSAIDEALRRCLCMLPDHCKDEVR